MDVFVLVVRSQFRCVVCGHVVVGRSLRMFMVVGRDGDSTQKCSSINDDMMASPG